MAEQHELLQGRLGRRTFLKGAALAGLASASPALWMQSARATGSPQVSRHLAFGADPQREAVVSFACATPFRSAQVEYGLDNSFGLTVPADVRSVPGVSTRYGHGRLQGLSPDTSYRYRIRLDGVVTGAGTLTTAPSRPEPFTFTAFGDEGVSTRAHSVIQAMGQVAPRFHLLAGDICYADSSGHGSLKDHFDPSVWDAWLTMIEPVAATTPWMCATGNHDMEPGYGALGYSGYLGRFVVPGNGAQGCPSTYSFRYGNVGFLCLDSNDVSYEIPHNLGYSHGLQTMWADQQLAAYRSPGSGVDFVVVYFHHCAFSTSSQHGSEGGVRDAWVPLFDKHEVDLVINGHAHLYERTSPLRGGHITADAGRFGRVDSSKGTTYITAGGGGAPLHGRFLTGGRSFVFGPDQTQESEATPWALPTKTTRHTFLAVDVTPADGGNAPTMRIRGIDWHGRLVDEVTLARRGDAAHGVDPLWVVGGGLALGGGALGTARWYHRRATAQDGPEAEVQRPL
jgi:hypothetical protein